MKFDYPNHNQYWLDSPVQTHVSPDRFLYDSIFHWMQHLITMLLESCSNATARSKILYTIEKLDDLPASFDESVKRAVMLFFDSLLLRLLYTRGVPYPNRGACSLTALGAPESKSVAPPLSAVASRACERPTSRSACCG